MSMSPTRREWRSESGTWAPPEFVALRHVEPTILQEIRYHGFHNFVGRPIPGYEEPACILTRQAAEALGRAQRTLVRRGYTLKVYDGYRPQRSVDYFVHWVQHSPDERMKAEFFPRVDRFTLLKEGYIAERSGHSRGSTVDVTVAKLPAPPQRRYTPGEPLVASYAPVGERFPDNGLDMGTGYDCFDTIAHTGNPHISRAARTNRELLKSTLEAVGFIGHEKEWWHFTLLDEPFPSTYFDFPVTMRALPRCA